MSLRLRIILLFLASELLLLGAFATGTFLFTKQRLTRSFDTALIANAEAIATLVHEDGEESQALELEFSDEVMSRFSRSRSPDIFGVILSDNQVLEASRPRAELPPWVEYVKSRRFADFENGGEHYRGVLISSRAVSEEDEQKGTPLTVFFATSREDLDDDLTDILEFLLIASGVCIGLSTLLALWIARRSLTPLGELAGQAEAIDASRLGTRFDQAPLPVELKPFAGAFNELLARLQEAFERERRFSGDAAHELRTPVAVLKSGIQAALLSPPDSTRDREALHELLEDIARIETLCEALLLTSRTENAATRRSVMASARLCEEVRATVDALAPLVSEHGASVTIQQEVSLAEEVTTDQISARRIVSNLVENAIRHGGQGVAVQIRIESIADGLTVVVEDNGPGIPAELRPLLFQRFMRGDESRTRSTGGAGLGLAISRALAERDRGTLTFEDSPTGRGARFVWRIVATRSDASDGG